MIRECLRHWQGRFVMENGVWAIDPPSPFEVHYRKARQAEGRILTDEQVRRYPTGAGLWNSGEWRIRRSGVKRLVRCLAARRSPLRILEVGCGNGWLSGWLSHAGHEVLGIDLFTEELEQAARVFPDVTFARADPFNTSLPEGDFDVVVFAASLQYFKEVHHTLDRARQLLRPEGEIHVLDTVLYRTSAEAKSAQLRSARYYEVLGVPEMGDRYHAHELDTLRAVSGAGFISGPSRWSRFQWVLGRSVSPFTHVVIRTATNSRA